MYVLEMELTGSVIKVGALGEIAFGTGSYAYVGSAQNGLKQRIERHMRDRKKMHWHIDYLLTSPKVKLARIWAKEADKKEECGTARLLAKHFDGIPHFGSSDCSCDSHMFRTDSSLRKLLISAGFREWKT
ncbi:MAG: GIY-YIG nuclease family protein [Candidatus Diapherotrites archaeon]|nr:GIY-YIG nuclease family protein [Candidatus Diapherotrites archaeon]